MEICVILIVLAFSKIINSEAYQCSPAEEGTVYEMPFNFGARLDKTDVIRIDSPNGRVAYCPINIRKCSNIIDTNMYGITIISQNNTTIVTLALKNVSNLRYTFRKGVWFSAALVYTHQQNKLCSLKIFYRPLTIKCNTVQTEAGYFLMYHTEKIYPKGKCGVLMIFNKTLVNVTTMSEKNKELPGNLTYFETNCTLFVPKSSLKPGKYDINVTMYPTVYNDTDDIQYGKNLIYSFTLDNPSISLEDCPTEVEEGVDVVCWCKSSLSDQVHKVITWHDAKGNSVNTNQSGTLSYRTTSKIPAFYCQARNIFGWKSDPMWYNINVLTPVHFQCGPAEEGKPYEMFFDFPSDLNSTGIVGFETPHGYIGNCSVVSKKCSNSLSNVYTMGIATKKLTHTVSLTLHNISIIRFVAQRDVTFTVSFIGNFKANKKCKPQIFLRPDDLTCNHYISSEGLFLTCSSTRVYPLMKCNFIMLFNESKITTNDIPIAFEEIPGKPKYFTANCSLFVPKSLLNPGTYNFNVTMYPTLRSNEADFEFGRNCLYSFLLGNEKIKDYGTIDQSNVIISTVTVGGLIMVFSAITLTLLFKKRVTTNPINNSSSLISYLYEEVIYEEIDGNDDHTHIEDENRHISGTRHYDCVDEVSPYEREYGDVVVIDPNYDRMETEMGAEYHKYNSVVDTHV